MAARWASWVSLGSMFSNSISPSIRSAPSRAEAGGWMAVVLDDENVSAAPQGQKRGELRIYLGAAPGVGKTFAMLGEPPRRLERGTDLVAAVVETHGRKKTAELLGDIEVVPPRYIDYRGS